MNLSIPDTNTMIEAFYDKDDEYDGIFFVAVKSTGIFCRPSCTARKPRQENIEFYHSTRDALLNGYRPCKVCYPLKDKGVPPEWLQPLLEELDKNSDARMTDWQIRRRGFEPNRIRRWFKKNHGMTFQAYQRMLRISQAFGRIRQGDKVIEAAYDSGYKSLSGFTEIFKKSTGFSPRQSSQKPLITVTRIITPLGPMLAGATSEGICLLEFIDRRMLELQLKRLRKQFKTEILPGTSPYFRVLDNQLQEYFNGKRQKFSAALDMAGTPFQIKVWKILQTIPYGTTRSYAEQAKLLGNINAVRAVARANGDNKIAIIIPCHRVIGSDGKLVGYGGGLWRKKYLLNLEMKNIGDHTSQTI
jgi:AraC family transcriptional regulator of adaptative response/methylated-DNA-[protein]-cysteine methyltransferase